MPSCYTNSVDTDSGLWICTVGPLPSEPQLAQATIMASPPAPQPSLKVSSRSLGQPHPFPLQTTRWHSAPTHDAAAVAGSSKAGVGKMHRFCSVSFPRGRPGERACSLEALSSQQHSNSMASTHTFRLVQALFTD